MTNTIFYSKINIIKGEQMITFEEIKNNKEINTYIEKADLSLKALGYT